MNAAGMSEGAHPHVRTCCSRELRLHLYKGRQQQPSLDAIHTRATSRRRLETSVFRRWLPRHQHLCVCASRASVAAASVGTEELVQGAAARHSPLVQSVAASTSKLQESIHGAVGDLPAAQSAPQTTLLATKRLQRQQSRAREQTTYKFAAILASTGVTAMAITAVYFRFMWHMRDGAEFPVLEAAATLLLTFGGVVGMEMWARWAHKVLWHDYEAGWLLHKSHHEPRLGPFEANDIYAIANAVPAIALCLYGFLTPTLMGGVSFGAGLGITLFGIMYMFIHDGMVHRRFPVGPIAELPYLKRCAIAHQLHHSERYGGVPWGMFLGPQELEAIGAKEELDRLCAELQLRKK